MDHNDLYSRVFDALGNSPFITAEDIALIAPDDFADILAERPRRRTFGSPTTPPPPNRPFPRGFGRFDSQARLRRSLLQADALAPLEQLLRWLRPMLRQGLADYLLLKIRADGAILLYANHVPPNFNLATMLDRTAGTFGRRQSRSPFARRGLTVQQVQAIINRFKPPPRPQRVNRRMYEADKAPFPTRNVRRPPASPLPRLNPALGTLKVKHDHVDYLYMEAGYDGRHIRLHILGQPTMLPRLYIGRALTADERPYVRFGLRLAPGHHLTRYRLQELGLQTAAVVRGLAVDVEDSRGGEHHQAHYHFANHRGTAALVQHYLNDDAPTLPPVTIRGYLRVPSLFSDETTLLEITLSFAYPRRPHTGLQTLYVANGQPRDNRRCQWAVMRAFMCLVQAGEDTQVFRRDTSGKRVLPEPYCVVDVQMSGIPGVKHLDNVIAEKVEAMAHDALVNLALADASLPTRLRRYASILPTQPTP